MHARTHTHTHTHTHTYLYNRITCNICPRVCSNVSLGFYLQGGKVDGLLLKGSREQQPTPLGNLNNEDDERGNSCCYIHTHTHTRAARLFKLIVIRPGFQVMREVPSARKSRFRNLRPPPLLSSPVNCVCVSMCVWIPRSPEIIIRSFG